MDDILGKIFTSGESLLGKYLDYQNQRDTVNALAEADERRYASQYRSRYLADGSLNPYYGETGDGMLPIVLIGGAVLLVGAIILAKV